MLRGELTGRRDRVRGRVVDVNQCLASRKLKTYRL